MTRAIPVLAALALSLSAAGAVKAADSVEVGTLDCVVEGGASFVFGSSRNLECTFTSVDPNSPGETYTGVIDKFGIDIGVKGKELIHWVVVAPANSAYAAGELAGEYTGASASASFAAGLGANVLVGGSERSFALQPVSVQAQEGVNLAVGIAQMKLAAAGPRG
jgi:Protein of unknown function (DUF992).